MGKDKTAKQVEVRMVNVSPPQKKNSKPRGCEVGRLVLYPERPIQRVSSRATKSLWIGVS